MRRRIAYDDDYGPPRRGGGFRGYDDDYDYGPPRGRQAPRNQEEAFAQSGKYQDSTGLHDINAGEGTRNVANLAGTAGNLGKSLGETVGAGINVVHGAAKNIFGKIGGFFKNLFTGKLFKK